MTTQNADTISVAASSYREPGRDARIREFSESFATSLPKRIFQWLYSFSLIIFIILTSAFIVVTPLDIVVQTYGAPSTGIKMFIIIAACALFLVTLVLFYLSRLFHSREAVNQIPSKSVYIPVEEHDLPQDVLKYIHKHLGECVGEIKVRAGPLHNKDTTLNYPGMSPPEYIQKRNLKLGFNKSGTLLPPNSVYDEIIDSLALRIRFDGALVTNFSIPPSFTFREVIISIFRRMSASQQNQPETIANMQKVIELYEKFRFGPELIAETELVTFLLAMETFSISFLEHRPDYDLLQRRASIFTADPFFGSRSMQSNNGIFDDEYRADDDSGIAPYIPSQGVSRTSSRLTGHSGAVSVNSSGSFVNHRRKSSSSTTGSVIKGRLEYRRSKEPYQSIGETEEASLRNYSGYLTDSEDDHDTIAT